MTTYDLFDFAAALARAQAEAALDTNAQWARRLKMEPDERLDNWFVYHAPTAEQIPLYGKLRDAGKVFAQVIVDCTPASADQTAALRKVREAVMTANAAIACGGK